MILSYLIVFPNTNTLYRGHLNKHEGTYEGTWMALPRLSVQVINLIKVKVKHKFKDWDKVMEDIMLELLRIKFAPGSELALRLTSTAGKSLAEAGRSVVYSIGVPINNRDIFNTRKWTKNLLGKMLMNVRQELLT